MILSEIIRKINQHYSKSKKTMSQSEQKLLTGRLSKFSIFKVDPIIGVSKFRIYLLRIFYIMAILMLGIEVWREIFTHQGLWQPLSAVAYSFWGAFSLLAILGLIHPLKMLPILLIQFSYKLIWLIIAAYPLWCAHQLNPSSQGLLKANSIGIVLDLLIIPWSYVFNNLILISKKDI
jgi:hypothetical protein